MRRILMLLGLLALVMAVATSSWAQSTSTLSGTVRDASGAVVPGAAITIKDQNSGDERKTVTTKEGVFSVPALHAGTYAVNAVAKGFANYTATDVVLNSNDARSIQITLPLASVTETVEVSAQTTSIVVEDSGAKGAVVSSDDIQNMVLGSRSAAEIVKLMAGANISSNSGVNRLANTTTIGINSYVVGGTAAGLSGTTINGQKVDITMDGGHTFDPGSPGDNSLVNPNTDMISEVKVLASSFSAENDYGPVVMNVATKGGGDKYHGNLHFYAQNAAMNSFDAFAKANKTPKLDAHQYYPGGNIGGPIPLPFTSYNKKHDKLFFWNGFDSYRQLLDGGVARAVVPTDAMRNNLDFSASSTAGVRNAGIATGVPYLKDDRPFVKWYRANTPGGWNCTISPEGVLTPGCVNKYGKALFDLYPRANTNPLTHDGYNYITSTLASDNSWQNVSRVDWSVSDNTKVFVRYSMQRETNNMPFGVWSATSNDNTVPAAATAVGHYSSDSLVASLTHVFSPTMTSETTFSITKSGMPHQPSNEKRIRRDTYGMPNSIFGNPKIPTLASTNGSPTVSGGGDYSRTPLQTVADKFIPSAKETLTKVYGAHTFKVGGTWEYIKNKQDTYGSFSGQINLTSNANNTNSTNNVFADVLMGVVAGGNYQESEQIPIIDAHQQISRFFVTDHWKLTRRLTVDIGMRFDHFGRPTTGNNMGLATWIESAYNPNEAVLNDHTGLTWHGANPAIPKGGANARLFFYSPRLGLAYDVFGNGKTVIRGGYGKFRSYSSITAGNTNNALRLAWGASNISCANTECPTYDSIDSALGIYKGHKLPGKMGPGRQGVNVINPALDEQPLTTTYNLQIDQKLPAKFMMEVSYVGNFSEHNLGEKDINAIPVGRISRDVYWACRSVNCSTNWNDSKDASGNPWRPRWGYKNINETMETGKTQYDSMQVSLHRSVGILNVMANYTWSKRYDVGSLNASMADWGTSMNWGVSREHRPHAINLAYTLNVPKVKTSNRIFRGAANGWQIAGTTSWSSGANMRSNAGDNMGYSWDTTVDPVTKYPVAGGVHDALWFYGGDQVTLFPTMVCNPNMKKKVTLADGTRAMQFLNPDCFKPTTSGSGSSHMGYMGGPAYFNSDLGIGKNFKVGEHHNLDFKLQAFNFLNHPLWSFSGGDSRIKAQFDGAGNMKNAATWGIATKKYGRRSVQAEVRYTF